jgi:hypothetical protein
VSAQRVWSDTGIDLRASDVASIVASGTILIAKNPVKIRQQQPGGFAPNCEVTRRLFNQPSGPVIAPQLSCWSLIGRAGAGGSIFKIGMRGDVPSGSAGRLFLGVNSDGNSADNSGSWTAVITVEHH